MPRDKFSEFLPAEDRVWAIFWVSSAMCVFLVVMTLCVWNYLGYRQTDNAIAALVAKGGDPISARCAIDPPGKDESAYATLCALHEAGLRRPVTLGGG